MKGNPPYGSPRAFQKSGDNVDVKSGNRQGGSNANPLIHAASVEKKPGHEFKFDKFDFNKFADEQETAEAENKRLQKADRKVARQRKKAALMQAEIKKEDPKDNVTNIGMGWHSNLDKASGRTYYANIHTRAVSWEWPDEVPRPGEAAKQIGAAPPVKKGQLDSAHRVDLQNAQLSDIYGHHTTGPNENRVEVQTSALSTLTHRKKKEETGSNKYFERMEARLRKVERAYDTEQGIEDRLTVLEGKQGAESASLERRRGLLFFGVESLSEDHPTIVQSRAWQAMTFKERVAETRRRVKAEKMNCVRAFLVVQHARFEAWFHKQLHSLDERQKIKERLKGMAPERVHKMEEWIKIAGPAAEDEDGRLNWNADLSLAVKKVQSRKKKELSLMTWELESHPDRIGGRAAEKSERQEERRPTTYLDDDLLDGDAADEDPGDPAKYEQTRSLHILTMYACQKVFTDDNPLPQQWSKARSFLLISYFIVVMQIFVMYRMVVMVALDNESFHGIAGFPSKFNVYFANNVAAPKFTQRTYVDYTLDFDPTKLNPNGCTKNDFKEEHYCDVACDGFACECEHVCVRRLAGIGSRGVRDGRKNGHEKTYYHEEAALEYTTDTNWCFENSNKEIDVSDENNDLVEGVPVSKAHKYPSFFVNDTIIKRCVSCHDILKSVTACARKGPQSSHCKAHSSDVIANCAERLCASSMQVNDELMIDNADFPGLLFMYVIIGVILVTELRELFISDVAFKRSIKNCKVMGYLDYNKKWLAFAVRVLQMLRRYFMLPGVVVLMCINNFSAETMLDVIASAIEMGFILDIDNLFFGAFFATNGERDLISDLLRVRLSPRQETKLGGAMFLAILCGVFQMTFFSLVNFRGKRCEDEKMLSGLMETVALAQCLALLPQAYCCVDTNVLKVQRFQNMMKGHGPKKRLKATFGVWKAAFAYGFDKFINLCVPASMWISSFLAEFFQLDSHDTEAPMTYVFFRTMALLFYKFVPWHVLLTTLFSIVVAVTNFGGNFLDSETVGDDVYHDWRGIVVTFMDWLWQIFPIMLATYGVALIPGDFPNFGFSMEDGSYHLTIANITLRTSYPTSAPTGIPTLFPSPIPTLLPTGLPTLTPTDALVYPSSIPTLFPTELPSMDPTLIPSMLPSSHPTLTGAPSVYPTLNPTGLPTMLPSFLPSMMPSILPTG